MEGSSTSGGSPHVIGVGAGCSRSTRVAAWSVQAGHDLLERVEVRFRDALPDATVLTHSEPSEDPVLTTATRSAANPSATHLGGTLGTR